MVISLDEHDVTNPMSGEGMALNPYRNQDAK
jgi:hypothetical protein